MPSINPPRRLFQNALILMLGQVLSAPLSFVTGLIIARSLGAKEFGVLYLANTVDTFGFLLVDWGQSAVITQQVARGPDQAGEILGSGLSWRLAAAPLIGLVMVGGAFSLRQDSQFLWVLALSVLCGIAITVCAAFQDTLRGFERMNVIAYVTVSQQILNIVFVGLAVLLHGGLKGVILAQTTTAVVLVLLVRTAIPPAVRVTFRLERVRSLLTLGFPFVALNVALQLEPLIDTLYLARLAPAEAIGWFSVAIKLIGGLTFPANALGTAFYPAWSRLWSNDRRAYAASVSTGLRTSVVMVLPIGLGCILYPGIGVALFSRKAFGPAMDDVRLLAFFLFAFYVTGIGSSALAAANRSRAWSICQFLCPAVSLVADPFLIRYFQTHYGNGGLGVCVTMSGNEVFLLACLYWLCPKGVFDRRFARTVLLALLAGAAMCGAALLLGRLPMVVSAVVSVAVYGACMWTTGGFDAALVDALRQSLGRRFRRAAPEAAAAK